MMKTGFLKIDWKSEPNIREKVLFAIIPLLLLVPCIRGLWLPVEGAINKSYADAKMIEMQSQTISKMLEMTSKEAEIAAANIPEDTKGGGRALRILGRGPVDRTQEVANTVRALASREMTANLQLKNIAVGRETVFTTYTAIPVDLIVEGGYSAIENYLKSLENVERPFLVRGIGITRGQDRGSRLDARVTLWVYLAGGSGKK